jgi:hypothetical protein
MTEIILWLSGFLIGLGIGILIGECIRLLCRREI